MAANRLEPLVQLERIRITFLPEWRHPVDHELECEALQGDQGHQAKAVDGRCMLRASKHTRITDRPVTQQATDQDRAMRGRGKERNQDVGHHTFIEQIQNFAQNVKEEQTTVTVVIQHD